jgi:CRISPR/Cas system-associated protein Cas5 (RAMP superfamily)
MVVVVAPTSPLPPLSSVTGALKDGMVRASSAGDGLMNRLLADASCS